MIQTFVMRLAQLNLSPLPNSGANDDYAKKAWETGLNIAFGTLAVIAVMMIVINGFQYITAGGDPQKMANAQKGVLYSLIGLVVVLFAAGIVTFALKGVGK